MVHSQNKKQLKGTGKREGKDSYLNQLSTRLRKFGVPVKKERKKIQWYDKKSGLH